MLTQHLQDKTTYKQLSKREMENHRRQLKQDYLDIFHEAKSIITKPETTFLTHTVQGGTIHHAQIYLTAKIYKRKGKEECPTRQIVTTPGSINHGPSKWVDFYLNHTMNAIEWILKDSFQLIHDTHKILKKTFLIGQHSSQSMYGTATPKLMRTMQLH